MSNILYVNGDSHTAAAEAVNTYAFAADDIKYQHLGNQPHPDNLKVSYGNMLARLLDFELVTDAESACSNDRILRTTREYLKNNRPGLIVIGWTNWERSEFEYEGNYYQFTANTPRIVWPEQVKHEHLKWVLTHNSKQSSDRYHEAIYELHLDIMDMGIPHIFFNCFHPFYKTEPKEWDNCYISPYGHHRTFVQWAQDKEFPTVGAGYHFGPEAHAKWAKVLVDHLLLSK
jgi:hypothetical protein